MTKNNRFTMYQNTIYDDGHIINAFECMKLLNFFDRKNDELFEENGQLKKQIGNLEHTKDFCAECCERLEKENEQLQYEIRKVQRAYVQLWMHKYK